MSWTRKIGHPNEILEKGQRVSCQVLNVDQDRKRIALGLKQLKQDPWETDIPVRYGPGDVGHGQGDEADELRRLRRAGARAGGAAAHLRVGRPQGGQPRGGGPRRRRHRGEVLRVDRGERKIGLSRKKAHESRDGGAEGEAPAPPSARAEPAGLKGGLGGGGPLFSLGGEPNPDPSPSPLDDEQG
jgi:small subunit ribosomal protein S1